MIVANQTTGMIVAQNAHVANTFISRLVGLLGRRELDSGEGLLILPCSGVHTLGMQFPIDVVALDKHDRVLRTWSRISPWRICGLVFAARSVLEVAAGVIEATGTKPGDQMQLQDA